MKTKAYLFLIMLVGTHAMGADLVVENGTTNTFDGVYTNLVEVDNVVSNFEDNVFVGMVSNFVDDAFTGMVSNFMDNVLVGVETNYSGVVYIGDVTNSNALEVVNGGSLQSLGSYLGYEANSSNNSALISGSSWTNWNDVVVGWRGSDNHIQIESGGYVENGKAYIGRYSTSAGNSATVIGSGTIWTNSRAFYIGYDGSENMLVVSNDAQVGVGQDVFEAGSIFSAGERAGSYGNNVVISGTNSIVRVSAVRARDSRMYVGSKGSYNHMLIEDGGKMVTGYGHIGHFASAHHNSMRVTGIGSVWTNTLDTFVGTGSSSIFFLSVGAGTFPEPSASSSFVWSKTSWRRAWKSSNIFSACSGPMSPRLNSVSV